MGLSVEELGRALAEIATRGDFAVPPYPAVALRLQRILARPGHAIGEVADALSADPALAARVLSVANSALYRGTSDITTVARAVNRLGTRTVASIALAAGVGASAMQAGALFDVKYRVWRRSVTCALACQKFAGMRSLDSEEAFLAGLLHGFGRSLAVAALEQLIAAQRPARPLAPSEWLGIAEQQRGALAAVMAKRWELPPAIAAATQDEDPPSAMGALVAYGDQLAGLLETGVRPEGASGAENRALEELISGLPHALDALAAVPSAPAPNQAAVAKADRTLSHAPPPGGLSVTDCKKQRPATLRCSGLTPAGLVLESSAPFQEGSMVRLAIKDTEGGFEPWFNVLLCMPAGAQQHVEVQLFSPTREIKERWQRLLEQAA